MLESLFDKVAGLKAQMFSSEYCKISKKRFFYRILTEASSAKTKHKRKINNSFSKKN